jgi:hypothetical protein
LSAFLLSCELYKNTSYAITVVNPDPSLGKVFIRDFDGEREVLEVFSKAYFQPTTVSIRAEMFGGQRAVFMGWREKYRTTMAGGEDLDYSDALNALEISDYTRVVTPCFTCVSNSDPHWISPDCVLFNSNRDGGDGLWLINPAGGAARRLTEPGRDSSGLIKSSHRGDRTIFCAAWKGCNILFADVHTEEPSTAELRCYCLDSGRFRVLDDTALEGSGVCGPYYFCDDGTIVCFLQKYLGSMSNGYSACLISPDGSFRLSDSCSAFAIEYAATGKGAYVFASRFSWVNEARCLTDFSVLDTKSGQVKTPADLQEKINGTMQVPFHAQSLATDGSAALLAMRWEDENGNSLGTSLAIVRGDGSVARLPESENYLPIDSDSIKLSPDGSSFTGKKGEAWARYSSIDGHFLETLSSEPADASPLWSACILDPFETYPIRLAAGTDAPDGNASVSAVANGKNTDLAITDISGTRWLTGPESEDVE